MSMDGRSSISMRRFKWLEVSVSSALVFALAWCGNALAQTRTYQYEYRATVDDATKIEALSDQLFGDSVSYVDGGVEFHVTDIKAKTNGLLPVGFGRRVAPARSPEGLAMQGKIDVSKEVLGRHWEPDLPVISGIYQDNSYFVNGTAPRCSSGKLSPSAIPMWPYNGPYYIWTYNFWGGVSANIPQQGTEQIGRIAQGTSLPTDGGVYKYTSKSKWMVSCLSSIKNGPGEGFAVTLPDGSKYYFDWMAVQTQKNLFLFNPTEPQRSVRVNRSKVMLFATKAVDRFGNSVSYSYDPSNPERILSIESSDGAAIHFQYNSDGKIASAAHGGRIWNYGYVKNPHNPDPKSLLLSSVKLPDGTSWSYEYKNDLLGYSSEAVGFSTNGNNCTFNPGTMTSSSPGDPSKEGVLKISHPSGAVGEFRFKAIVHGKNNVTSGACGWGDSSGWVLSGRPKAYPLSSLISKSISGPGLVPKSWSISYSPSWSYSAECGARCAASSTTVVTSSTGIIESYVFGNDFQNNDGQLLSKIVSSQNGIARREDYSYQQTASGQAFQDYYVEPEGLNETLDNQFSKRNVPLKKLVIAQDGASFISSINAFDARVRPLSITKSSSTGHGKTETLEYQDDTTLWVLGQVKRTTTDGVETSRTTYGWKALPTQSFSFGKLRQTLTYDSTSAVASGQLGTVKTVADGNSNVTTLGSWKRGIPQSSTLR